MGLSLYLLPVLVYKNKRVYYTDEDKTGQYDLLHESYFFDSLIENRN
ncbi:hypothetical protein SAMN04488700_0772 [Carnobacterium iners]|uniref:Uncharacterized protein n=1 Tax=Carnobacterium iners TaxID=1073423 RepID=A0A1X7MTA5_9LACT|nr:hypothetical protein SAMN04488114_11611 [Carnobacterium iners]SMH27854.1 hypothetical protein SAMN04488700_0772 [Carnobacterium iners]